MSFISEAEASIRLLFDTVNLGFNADPSKGQDHLENWIQHLRGIDHATTRPIVTELETLRGHVNGNNPAGMALSFQKLGELTALAAAGTHCVAFWLDGSAGTADMIARARKHNLKVKVLELTTPPPELEEEWL